jgi:hypothetical protein
MVADFSPSSAFRRLIASFFFLVGLNLRHRQRRRRFHAAHGQAHGARVDQRNKNEPEQARHQKADAQIHGRLDHDGNSNRRALSGWCGTGPCHGCAAARQRLP